MKNYFIGLLVFNTLFIAGFLLHGDPAFMEGVKAYVMPILLGVIDYFVIKAMGLID